MHKNYNNIILIGALQIRLSDMGFKYEFVIILASVQHMITF